MKLNINHHLKHSNMNSQLKQAAASAAPLQLGDINTSSNIRHDSSILNLQGKSNQLSFASHYCYLDDQDEQQPFC